MQKSPSSELGFARLSPRNELESVTDARTSGLPDLRDRSSAEVSDPSDGLFDTSAQRRSRSRCRIGVGFSVSSVGEEIFGAINAAARPANASGSAAPSPTLMVSFEGVGEASVRQQRHEAELSRASV